MATDGPWLPPMASDQPTACAPRPAREQVLEELGMVLKKYCGESLVAEPGLLSKAMAASAAVVAKGVTPKVQSAMPTVGLTL